MKFTSVETMKLSGELVGYAELSLIADGEYEKAMARAVAEELTGISGEDYYCIQELPTGVVVKVKVSARTFEELQIKAIESQDRFEKATIEALRLRRMLKVIERASRYTSDGLSKPKKADPNQ